MYRDTKERVESADIPVAPLEPFEDSGLKVRPEATQKIRHGAEWSLALRDVSSMIWRRNRSCDNI